MPYLRILILQICLLTLFTKNKILAKISEFTVVFPQQNDVSLLYKDSQNLNCENKIFVKWQDLSVVY